MLQHLLGQIRSPHTSHSCFLLLFPLALISLSLSSSCHFYPNYLLLSPMLFPPSCDTLNQIFPPSFSLRHKDAQRVKIRLRHKETVSQWGVTPTQIYFSHWPAPGTGYSIIFDSFRYTQHCPLPVISFRIQFSFPQQGKENNATKMA